MNPPLPESELLWISSLRLSLELDFLLRRRPSLKLKLKLLLLLTEAGGGAGFSCFILEKGKPILDGLEARALW